MQRRYTFRDLLKEILVAKDGYFRDSFGREVWGTNPEDFGEGMSFSYSGDHLLDPTTLKTDSWVLGFEVEKCLAAMERLISWNLSKKIEKLDN